ncbi:Phosphohistidine phosphatase SixA [hydrothermal vent metagenome]|uniref:Phosphohistidine phosphatase SixA n=1 Tax=hydrothermal vent metagenome TaxID=652676 RepID=A0A3B1AGI6_9ZZZZ
MKSLLLFRHAKSNWGHPGLRDFDRPLNQRGNLAAVCMGRWMNENHLQPQWVICSTAHRAKQTLQGLCEHLVIPDTQIKYLDRLYLANVTTLLGGIVQCPRDGGAVMLIGHNPGLEDLLLYLCGPGLPLSGKGKLMATATLAQVHLPNDWQQLAPRCGKLQRIIRPREIA